MAEHDAVGDLRSGALPFERTDELLPSLIDAIGDGRVVLIGESSGPAAVRLRRKPSFGPITRTSGMRERLR